MSVPHSMLVLDPVNSRPDVSPAPIPCLWKGCPLLLWHVGEHAPPSGDHRCLPRIELRDTGRIVYWNVQDDRKEQPARFTVGQHAEVAPRSWIRLFGSTQGQAFDRVFVIGDEAAYGGFNLTYTGRIVAIGRKTIKIRDERVNKRLSIYDFLAWNRHFDSHRTRAKNREVMERI